MFIYEMTVEQYLHAYKKRMKKNGAKQPGLSSFILAIAVFIIIILIRADLFFFVLPVIIVAFGISEIFSVNAVITREYNKMPYVYGKQKCILDENGITIQNSFERMFISYKDLYGVINNRKYVLVFMTYSKGIIFLDKKKNKEESQILLEGLKKGGVEI